VIGKEVFGGYWQELPQPRADGPCFPVFLPTRQKFPVTQVWTAVDGYAGATALSMAASGGIEAVVNGGITWLDAFVGNIHGLHG